MEDTELRLAAIEKLLLALIPWVNEQVVEDAAATIRSELATAQGEDREAALYALELLTDGKDRFQPPALGRFIRGG